MTVVLALVTGVLASACGVLPGGGDGSGAAPASPLAADFTMSSADGGKKRVVGHGFSFLVPSDWTEYAPENTIADGSSREWAVQAAAPKDPFVPYISISAAFRPGRKNDVSSAVQLFKGVQALNKSFHIVDEGESHVGGAKTAYHIHSTNENDVQLPGDTQKSHLLLETNAIYLNMPDGELTIVRFIAPQSHFRDGGFDAIEKTLAVHVGKATPTS